MKRDDTMQGVANLDQNVREMLRSKITTGELSGGAHLSELKIAKEYSVSRTPVREALCALAADGLIEMVPHRGAFVRTVTSDEITDQKTVFAHMMSLAAHMATERADIESILALENLVSSLKTTDVATFETTIIEAFSLIRKGCGSTTAAEVLNMVERRMVVATPVTLTEDIMKTITQEFTYLMGAFKRKKADVAEKTMRTIISTYYGIEAETVETTTETVN
jgi:DNA-binding GntR family transcriptional regulator